MRSTKGFTLIELVVVIVILGILAVTAAPKFLNFSKDAKIATVKGFKGVISAQVSMLNSKAMIQGKTGDNVDVETDYGLFQFYGGYPESRSESTSPHKFLIQTFIDLGAPESETLDGSTRSATHGDVVVYEDNDYSRVGYGSGNLLSGNCYAEYQSDTADSVKAVTTGC
ncbi:type II secretion system protein [Parasalinivibrio latis]|uniref:type II secretion system protein n=1 Tax=Parasalinivibrio latis TaxID=2952610 RepID=UPI003DA6294A